MTVMEFTELIKDKNMTVIVYDDATNKILHVDFDDLHHATVKAISTDGDSFKVFVETPLEKYYTYLDITYSTRIELDIPEFTDREAKEEAFRSKAAEIISAVPDAFSVNGYHFSYGYDNRQTGGLEDMIEKC